MYFLITRGRVFDLGPFRDYWAERFKVRGRRYQGRALATCKPAACNPIACVAEVCTLQGARAAAGH